MLQLCRDSIAFMAAPVIIDDELTSDGKWAAITGANKETERAFLGLPEWTLWVVLIVSTCCIIDGSD